MRTQLKAMIERNRELRTMTVSAIVAGNPYVHVRDLDGVDPSDLQTVAESISQARRADAEAHARRIIAEKLGEARRRALSSRSGWAGPARAVLTTAAVAVESGTDWHDNAHTVRVVKRSGGKVHFVYLSVPPLPHYMPEKASSDPDAPPGGRSVWRGLPALHQTALAPGEGAVLTAKAFTKRFTRVAEDDQAAGPSRCGYHGTFCDHLLPGDLIKPNSRSAGDSYTYFFDGDHPEALVYAKAWAAQAYRLLNDHTGLSVGAPTVYKVEVFGAFGQVEPDLATPIDSARRVDGDLLVLATAWSGPLKPGPRVPAPRR